MVKFIRFDPPIRAEISDKLYDTTTQKVLLYQSLVRKAVVSWKSCY